VPGAGAIDTTGGGSFSPASHTGALTIRMNLPAGSGLSTLRLQIVLAAPNIYMKLPAELASRIPGGKPWLTLNLDQAAKAAGIPGFGALISGSSSISDPAQYLSYLRATAVGSVQDLGAATINGVRTTHYHGRIDLTKLPTVVPAAQRPGVEQLVAALRRKGAAIQMPIDVWIDSSHLVRRLETSFAEPLGNGQSVNIALTEDFLQYGPQPRPVIPSPGQTADLLSLVHGGA
jgi:hypothetical protein